MIVAVTGCLGYIGSNVCARLLSEGYEVIGIDNTAHSEFSRLWDIERVAGKKFKRFYIDDLAENPTSIDLNGVDIILHFASYISVEESVNRPLSYYNNNINSTINVCKLAKSYGVKKIIYSSSATVYNTDLCEAPYSEGDPVRGTTPYGRTKLYSEEILKDFVESEDDMQLLIFRFFNPAGTDESGLLRDLTKSHLFPSILRAISLKLPLVIYGCQYDTFDGTCERDYVHISDLVDGHILGIQYLNTHSDKVTTLNLGTGKSTTVKEIFDTMNNLLDGALSYTYGPERDGDVAKLYADISNARKVLGYEPKKSIEDICRSELGGMI